jgi:hypothetical protein
LDFGEYVEDNRCLASMLEGEETPENTERNPDGPEPAAERDIQMYYPVIIFTAKM